MKTLLTLASVFFLSLSLSAQNQVDLKFNLEKGKTYRLKSSSVTTLDQNIMGRQQSTENSSTNVLSITPVEINPNSFKAEVKFDTISIKTSMPQIDAASYKSGSLSANDPSAILNVILSRLSRSVIAAEISNTGKVLSITNLKAIKDSVFAGLDTIKGQMAQTMQTQVKSLVSEESLTGMIDINTAHLPGSIVKTGDKWEAKVKISSNGIGILVNSSYKLKKITGNEAEIKGDITNEPASSEPIEMGGAQITYNARGIGEVTFVVDIRTGWIIKSSSKTHSQGDIGVKAQGQEFTIPTEIESNSETIALP
jgi:hypothetical protein